MERYESAVKRSLNEIRYAISMRHAYNNLCTASDSLGWNFFGYSSIALFNDSFSHTIKVLDEHKDVSAFWYIYRSNREIADKALEENGIDLEKLKQASKSLKLIRNKTHFHIDKIRVSDSSSVWKEAGISGDRFNYAQDGVWSVLRSIHLKCFGEPYLQPIYSGEDISNIVSSVKSSGINI